MTSSEAGQHCAASDQSHGECPVSYNHSLTGHLVRIVSPYRTKIKGMGIIAAAMNPRRVFPQPRPSLWYMVGPAKGRNAARTERRTVFAAMESIIDWAAMVSGIIRL